MARSLTSRCRLVCLAAVLHALTCGTPCVADDTEQAKFAVEGFLANYSAFEFYTADMTIRTGKAASVERALAAGPETDVVVGKARLVVDGKSLCYERSTEDKIEWDPTTSKGSMQLTPSLFIRSAEWLGYGSQAMSLLSVQRATEGTGLTRWSEGVDMTTWNGAGGLAPGEGGNFGQFVAPQFIPAVEFTVRDGVEILGAKTQQIDLRWDGGAISFFVDSHRGFIPIETRSYLPDGSTPITRLFVTDIRECSGKRWFPMRSLAVWIPLPGQPQEYQVREIVVTRLDADMRPPPNAFALKLPAGFVVNDPDQASGQYRLSEAETVTLANLPSFHERTVRPVVPAQEQPPEKSPIPAILLIINVVVVLALIALVLVRLRRKRSQA